ncbi:MAG TPA: DUF6311 domain-containing protein, partial [Polyangiales bacterium]|nr:DUF6311 domain-containing protein [Polyangiales bacterium]
GYGLTLDPRHIEWMLWGDWVQPLWSFSFYRNAPWMLPLGALPNWIHPFGSSVGFADSNPGLSAVFKIFSPLMPEKFQFSGLWFLLCYTAQAYFGARIVALLGGRPIERALGGLLFALTPVLPMRHHHIVLSGVFFVSGMLYFALRPSTTRAAALRSLIAPLVMVFWASTTNGYHSIMVLGLYTALCLRLAFCDRLISTLEAGLALASGLTVTFFAYWLVGYLGYQRTLLQAEGFGDFSADLLSLINPLDWSRFFPGMPMQGRQWEGAAYLGVGVLALLLLRVVLWGREPERLLAQLKRYWPVVAAILVMSFYSLSSRVTLRGEEVLSLGWLYDRLPQLTNIFRSSGRFIWTLHMALIGAGISAVLALKNPRLRVALLLAAVLLQATELKADNVHFSDAKLMLNKDPVWAASAAHYRHLKLLPIRIQWICPDYREPMVSRFAYEAFRRKWSYNSGLLGRNPERIRDACSRGLEGPVDPQTIYVVQAYLVPAFQAAHATCGTIDSFTVCVDGKRATPMRAALERAPLRRLR